MCCVLHVIEWCEADCNNAPFSLPPRRAEGTDGSSDEGHEGTAGVDEGVDSKDYANACLIHMAVSLLARALLFAAMQA